MTGCVKLKFHWGQFPRNFPVANVTGKSPTSYEEVADVANKSAMKLRRNWSQWNLSFMRPLPNQQTDNDIDALWDR